MMIRFSIVTAIAAVAATVLLLLLLCCCCCCHRCHYHRRHHRRCCRKRVGNRSTSCARLISHSFALTHSLEEGALAINTIKNISSSASSERTNERAQASAAVACRICEPLPPLLYVGACGFGVSVFAFQSRFRGSILATLLLRLRPAIVALLPEIVIKERSDCRSPGFVSTSQWTRY